MEISSITRSTRNNLLNYINGHLKLEVYLILKNRNFDNILHEREYGDSFGNFSWSQRSVKDSVVNQLLLKKMAIPFITFLF